MGAVEEFGRALYMARTDVSRRLSQGDLARMIGVDTSIISDWERAKRKRPPDRELVEALEEAMGIGDGRLLAAADFRIHRGGIASVRAESHVSAVGEVDVAKSLSYGGDLLTADQEHEILAYIDFVKERDRGRD